MSDVSTYSTAETVTKPQRRGKAFLKQKAPKICKPIIKEPVFPANSEELFNDYWPQALGLAISKGVPDAKQVANDGLSDAMRNFDLARGSFGGRMFTMVCRRAGKAGKKAAKQREHEVELTEEWDKIAGKEGDGILDVELAKAVRAALSALSSDDWHIIVGKFLLGKTYVEIARELDMPLGTVKGRVPPAFLKLRPSLRDFAPTPS